MRRPEGVRRLLVMLDLVHEHLPVLPVLPVLFVCRYVYREDWYAACFAFLERTLHWRQQKLCDELPVPWGSDPSLRCLFEAKELGDAYPSCDGKRALIAPLNILRKSMAICIAVFGEFMVVR